MKGRGTRKTLSIAKAGFYSDSDAFSTVCRFLLFLDDVLHLQAAFYSTRNSVPEKFVFERVSFFFQLLGQMFGHFSFSKQTVHILATSNLLHRAAVAPELLA